VDHNEGKRGGFRLGASGTRGGGGVGICGHDYAPFFSVSNGGGRS
jgi:hypothetical protein